jgi:hypothetical protein
MNHYTEHEGDADVPLGPSGGGMHHEARFLIEAVVAGAQC